MRILYLTSTSIYSGGEKITLAIAKAMQSRGHHVIYCGCEGEIQEVVKSEGVEFYCLSKFSLYQVYKIIKDVQPDYVHCMDYRASTYASLFFSKIISHLHSNPPWLKTFCFNSLALLFFTLRAKAVFTVSRSIFDEFCLKKIMAKKVLDSKIKILPNFIDIEKIRQQSTVSNMRVKNNFDLIFIGRFEVPKRPECFVQCVAEVRSRHPHIKAVMLGDGSLYDIVVQQIAKYKLQDTIFMAGREENPFPWLQASKILVVPSAWEGFGLVAAEAMTLAKPVVAISVGGLKDVVSNNSGILCDSTEELSKAVNFYLENDDAYVLASKNAKVCSNHFMNESVYYDIIENIYIS